MLDAIYCDDIRQETSGKHTLVGVYENTARIICDPAVEEMVFNVSVFVRLLRERDDPGFDQVVVALVYRGEMVASARTTGTPGEGPIHSFALRQIPVKIAGEGELTVLVVTALGGKPVSELKSRSSLSIVRETPGTD